MQAKNDGTEGEWKNPFGIPGVTIRELAMQIGFTYEEPWIDDVGIHGNMKIGDLNGSISVLVDTNDPDQFVLAGATDHLTILDILTSLSPATLLVYQAACLGIPPDAKKVLDNFIDLNVNNAKLYIVPVSTSIGAIDFEQGMTIMGSLDAWGWNANVLIKLDYLEGMEVHGEMDNINLSNVLRISGSQNDPAPLLNLTILPKTVPELLVTGSIYLLGLSQNLLIKADQSGFNFYFDRSIANILDTNLTCSFGDGGNLNATGSIVFHLNVTIPSPFGNISLVDIAFDAGTSLKVGPKYGFETVISGSFSFYGHSVTMPTLTINVAPNDFTGIFNAVVAQIADNAGAIFEAIFGTLAEWADAIKNGVIEATTQVASVAKNIYKATEEEVISAYQTLNKSADQIAAGLKSAYGYSSQALTTALKGAGYASDQVASALGSAYNFGQDATAAALKNVGYAVNQVGDGIKSAYNLGAKEAAIALKSAGYAVDQTGDFLKNAYGLGADELNTALKGAGYAADQVGNFFQSLGGTFADVGNKILDAGKTVGNALNPTHW